MPSLLEEAILDAKLLREAALKTAENQIIEQYSEQVRSAKNTTTNRDITVKFKTDGNLIAAQTFKLVTALHTVGTERSFSYFENLTAVSPRSEFNTTILGCNSG